MVNRVLSRIPRVRAYLDSWHVWMLIAYFGLAAIVVTLFVLFGRLAREEADRAAITHGNDAARVSQCYESAKNYPNVKGFIDAHQALIENSIIGTVAALRVTPRRSPFYRIRSRSLVRLRRAHKNAAALIRIVVAGKTTLASCGRLARKLHVPVPPAERKP